MNRKPLPLGRAIVVAAAVLSMSAAVRSADLGRLPSTGMDKSVEPAISRPSDEAKPTFAAPGLVAEVLVKEGDVVKVGQVLSKQDDRIEAVALASAKMDAESTAEIDYEKADVTLKELQYKRKLDLYNEPGHPIALTEVEEAKNALDLARAQVTVAQLHHDQKGMDAQKQGLKVELMQLRSPIDGVVQKINAHAGEMSDPQSKDGALVVVKNDPLWVEMNIAAARAEKLSIGQELQVRYKALPGEAVNPWMTGKINYFPPHADAASGTELVRLTLANPSGQRSGLAMEVRLPENAATVATDKGGTPALANGQPGLPPLSN